MPDLNSATGPKFNPLFGSDYIEWERFHSKHNEDTCEIPQPIDAGETIYDNRQICLPLGGLC